MPLKIIVVGAGIAGLTSAIALRQAGHEVSVFERSQFATEVGAALIISPNGARVLNHLNFSFQNARAVTMDRWSVLHGELLVQLANVDMSAAEARFGAGAYAIHRVDLHTELLRLASSTEISGTPVKIHLSSEIVAAETEGTIVLKDGTRHTADLVVAADGLKSVLKGVVTEESTPPTPTGLSAFRFLINTSVLEEDENLKGTLEKKGSGATLLADIKETEKERHMMWYACRGGEVQNFVGIHPSRDVDGDDPEAVKKSMLDEFSHFSPGILDIVRKSSAVKCWPLFSHKPLSNWYNGRIVLIGDAAHPMLPFGGQGANAAIEDGGSLGYLFKDIADASTIPEKLSLFQKARQSRASRVQILSSVRAGKEKEVEEKLQHYSDPPGSKVPTNMMERTGHDYGFNVYKKCDEVLAAAQS
ncbi:putative salicylate hydroxylase [Massarina eburnea CBS 473.64]|uniref:Putative salicylate hydroxylase n=1 Tax=Massarina eburnea CBS 473.64 TaxID=1395130 RepID=A0A6A6RZ62_9PLEO|nr:putative salicylate hydroxylase [Massarina eburnea CBS 473.64]